MKHLARVFIPNVILTVNPKREGREVHVFVDGEGQSLFADDACPEGSPAKLPDEWDALGISRAYVIQCLSDTVASRNAICGIIEAHRVEYGTASLHTEGTGTLISWADDGAVRSDVDKDDDEPVVTEIKASGEAVEPVAKLGKKTVGQKAKAKKAKGSVATKEAEASEAHEDAESKLGSDRIADAMKEAGKRSTEE